MEIPWGNTNNKNVSSDLFCGKTVTFQSRFINPPRFTVKSVVLCGLGMDWVWLCGHYADRTSQWMRSGGSYSFIVCHFSWEAKSGRFPFRQLGVKSHLLGTLADNIILPVLLNKQSICLSVCLSVSNLSKLQFYFLAFKFKLKFCVVFVTSIQFQKLSWCLKGILNSILNGAPSFCMERVTGGSAFYLWFNIILRKVLYYFENILTLQSESVVCFQ